MLQAFHCEACGSIRPSSNSAALQEDEPSSSSHQGDGDAKHEGDKGKKKGKTGKFERLRITGKKLLSISGQNSGLTSSPWLRPDSVNVKSKLLLLDGISVTAVVQLATDRNTSSN